MFGRKGQGAMEYLMTYGWAILVVMIVGIVMWQLGIFNLGSTSVTASGFPKIKPLLASCKMTTGGTFTCLFTNGAGTSITVNDVVAKLSGSSTTCTDGASQSSISVGVGDNFLVNQSACATGTPTSGDPYSVDVYISYSLSVAGTTVTHNDTGKVKGPYEQV